MTSTAADVAAALRDRLPSVPTKKLHKLLYYCQGHHLAATGAPLFSESISAWDLGPVVGSLWKAEQDSGIVSVRTRLNEASLNTVGYVVSRYGKLSGRDLELLTHAEPPWRRADALRLPGGSVRIENTWLVEYFGSDSEAGTELGLDSEAVSRWLADAPKRRRDELQTDLFEAVRSRMLDAS